MFKNDIDVIKKLIQRGFDLELISLELDIPLKEIQQIKQEMDKPQNSTNIKTYSYNEIVNNRNKEANIKLEQVRERYRKLFYKNDKSKKAIQKQSAEEKEKIDLSITEIENIIKEIEEASKSEKREKINIIISCIKDIQDYQLTIEQAEQLNTLLQSKELENIRLRIQNSEKLDSSLRNTKKMIIKKLAEAVDIAQNQTENIEELRTLQRKLTSEMERQVMIQISTVKSKINNKIVNIQQKEALERMRNDISEDVLEIINDLANGTMNIEKANEIIDKEAKNKVDGKPKNKFTLTEEQERKQIIIKIGIAIKEKADRFYIVNPETTVLKIKELNGGNLRQAVNIVVENLISAKRFEEAQQICNRFSEKSKEDGIEIRDFKLKIRNAEISDIVLKCINMNGTEEEERKCFELIEKGLKVGNVKLKSISLGKSQDGTKNITLADIWPDEVQR